MQRQMQRQQLQRRQQQGLCQLCKKYGVGRGKAAAQLILPQPAKSSLVPLLPLLLPTLLLLKPLLLLTSQMATLDLTQRLRLLGLTSQISGLILTLTLAQNIVPSINSSQTLL